MSEYIIDTRYLRVSWSPVFALGMGIDPTTLTLGFYCGPWCIFIGDPDLDA